MILNALSDLGVTKYDHSRRITYYLVLAFCNHWAGKGIELKKETCTNHSQVIPGMTGSIFDQGSDIPTICRSVFGDGRICSTPILAVAPPRMCSSIACEKCRKSEYVRLIIMQLRLF